MDQRAGLWQDLWPTLESMGTGTCVSKVGRRKSIGRWTGPGRTYGQYERRARACITSWNKSRAKGRSPWVENLAILDGRGRSRMCGKNPWPYDQPQGWAAWSLQQRKWKEDHCVLMHRGKIQGTRLATLYPLVPAMSEDSEG